MKRRQTGSWKPAAWQSSFSYAHKYTPNGNFIISLQIWVRFGLQNLQLVPLSTYEFRVICDSESYSLLYGVNEFLSILTFLPISITLYFMFILCLWFRASLIYINNCPTRSNTKRSIYYSASSLYMFRVSSTTIIRRTQNCNYSLRYWLFFFCSYLPPN